MIFHNIGFNNWCNFSPNSLKKLMFYTEDQSLQTGNIFFSILFWTLKTSLALRKTDTKRASREKIFHIKILFTSGRHWEKMFSFYIFWTYLMNKTRSFLVFLKRGKMIIKGIKGFLSYNENDKPQSQVSSCNSEINFIDSINEIHSRITFLTYEYKKVTFFIFMVFTYHSKLNTNQIKISWLIT